jgi:hypothetical protein
VRLILSILFLFLTGAGWAQTGADTLARTDTARRADTVRLDTVPRVDSAALRAALRADSIRQVTGRQVAAFLRGLDTARFTKHPYYRFNNPARFIAPRFQWQGKDALFYCLVALVLYFALLRSGFTRYLQDLFRLFTRTTMKQRQIRETLLASPLPSLLFNILFVLSGALFITLVLQHYTLGRGLGFWMLYLYSIAGLAAMYTVKFLSLKFMGWVFNLAEATEAYLFIVFTTNKIVGILLLPFSLVLAFTAGSVYQAGFVLSLVLVGGLFLYRFFLAYVSVYRLVRIDLFHFVLYLLAMEITPLLLINKVLVQFFANSY